MVVAVAAAALQGLVAVVRGFRQAASQRTAAAVAERAGQGTIAEGDDAALEHTDFPVVPPALAKGEKDEWKMHDGTVVRGKAYAFGRQLCFLQRRNGKLLMNGQKIDDPASNALLKKLCEEQGVPIDDPKRLQEILSKQRFAQAVLPFFTLRYHDQAGRDSEVPTILLAPEEIQELRPVFEAWMKEKQKEHEEQVRKAQELANQQALLAMQAEALRAQQDMARAAQRSADANKKAADELERLRRKSN